MTRFFVQPEQLQENFLVLTGENAAHAKVLRLKTGAQVLVLGCLSYLGMGKDLEALLDVPVIDPAMAAVTLAESMVRQKLSHSAKAFLTRDALTTVL